MRIGTLISVLAIIFLVPFALLFIPTSVNAALQDFVYKDHVYSMKSLHYDLVESIRSEITLSEDALSGLSFDNSEAIKKIDTAWKIRSMAWDSHGATNAKLKQAESYLNNKQYRNSYNSLLVTNEYLYTAKDDLYAIVNEIKGARDLEKQYQEKDRWCFFFFWCSEIKNTYGTLDAKIPSLESKLVDIENKLSELETKKNLVIQSLYKSEIDQKNIEIQKIQTLRQQEQLAAEKQEHELQKKIRLEREEAERQEQRQQAEIERQKILRQQQEEEYEVEIKIKEIAKIREKARTNPVIAGIISGELRFYIAPLPSYAAAGSEEAVKDVADVFENYSFYGGKVKRVYDPAYANIYISWIKNFGTTTLGHAVFMTVIEMGVGMDNCYGDWQPFTPSVLKRVLWHEIGHSVGYAHSTNTNNVMYKSTPFKFEVDYEKTVTLDEGNSLTIPFCDAGSYWYNVKTDDTRNGIYIYVISAGTNTWEFLNGESGSHYPSCGPGKAMVSYSISCNVNAGDSLLIYNKNELLQTSASTIQVKIIDQSPYPWPDMTWDENAFQYDKSELYEIWDLFH